MPKKERSIVVKSFEVSQNGQTIRVPVDKNENRIANMISAAQMRDLIQTQIKRYKDGELDLSPKELKDLAEALSTVSKMSGDVYEGANPEQEDETTEKSVSEAEPDFSKVVEVKTEEKK